MTMRCRAAYYGWPVLLVAAMLATIAKPRAADAADWPQLLGENRNGQLAEGALPAEFPKGKLTPKFTYALGAGFAGPAVAGNRVLVFHRVDDEERLESLDARTGEVQWTASFPADYRGGYSSDTGPRCVPLVHDRRVFVFGASGHAHAVALEDGRKLWTRTLAKDYKAPEGYFGHGASPLVAGDKLLINLGGRERAGIVALSLDTGRTVWKATDEQVSYASPIRAELHGKAYYLFLTRSNLLGLDAEQGDVLLKHPFGKPGLTVTGATPLAFGNRIFLTASYNIGAQVIEVDPQGAVRILWQNDDTLSSQYTSSVYVDGYLYGTHGREDGPAAELRCVEAETGRVAWSEPGVGVAHVLAAGNRLLVVRVQQGELRLVQATPERYTELDQRLLTGDKLRALPALVDGALYLRTTDERTDRGELWAVDIGSPKPAE